MNNTHIPFSQLTKILLGYLVIGLCGYQLSLVLNIDLRLELSFAVALALVGKDRTIYICMLGSFILRWILGLFEQVDIQTIAVMSAWSALGTLVQCKASLYAIRSILGTRWRRLLDIKDFYYLFLIGGIFSSLINATFELTEKAFIDNNLSVNFLIIIFIKKWMSISLGALIFLPIFLSLLLRHTAAWRTRYKSIVFWSLFLVGVASYFGLTNKNFIRTIANAELAKQAITPSILITKKIADIEGAITEFSTAAKFTTAHSSTHLSEISKRIFSLNPSIRSLSVLINPETNATPSMSRTNQDSREPHLTNVQGNLLLHFGNPRYSKTPVTPEIISQYVNEKKNTNPEGVQQSFKPFNLINQQKDTIVVRYDPPPFENTHLLYPTGSGASDISTYTTIDIDELQKTLMAEVSFEQVTPWKNLSIQMDALATSNFKILPLTHLMDANNKYELISFILSDQVLSLQAQITDEWISKFSWKIIFPIEFIKIIVALLYLTSIFLITTRQYRLRVLLDTQEAKLDQKNQRLTLFQQSIDNALEAIAILKMQSEDLHVDYVNDSFCKMAALPGSEIIGTVWTTYFDFPINVNALSVLKQSVARGVACRAELMMLSNQSQWRWVDMTLAPVLNDENTTMYWLLTQQDITERKRIELELKRSELEARSLSATKSRFLENISHEIRTPLSGIIGLINLAQDVQDPRIIQQHLNAIKTSATHQLEIITSILNALKVEASQIRATVISINLRVLLKEAVEILLPNAQLKNIEVNVKVSNNIPIQIDSDPLLLKQILLNLIANAIKFTSKGHVDITVDYLFSNEQMVGIRFSIADSGIGLGSLSLKKIVQPFFKGESRLNTDGIGLGLSIVESYLQLMNSHLQVQSRNNFGGATFYFDLNCKYSTQAQEIPLQNEVQIPSLAQSITTDAFVGLRFLIIEDNLINQIVLMGYLNDTGATIDIASNGQSALSKITSTEYDLIFLDLRIPNFDTATISKHLDRIHVDLNTSVRTPIIGISASQQDDYDVTVKRYGLRDFLIKPFEQAQLFEVIKKHVFSNTGEIEAALASGTTDTSRGSRAVLSLELQQLFLEQALTLRPKFEQFFNPHAHTELLNALHLIQGSAAAFALHDLQQAAQSLEYSIRKGTRDIGNYTRFIQKYDKQIIIYRQSLNAVTPRAQQESQLQKTSQFNHQRRHFNILLIEDNILVSKVLGSQITAKGLSIDFAYDSEEALLKLDTHHYDILITDLILPDIDGLTLTKIITAQSRFKDKIIFGLSAYMSDTIEQACQAAGIKHMYSKLSDPSVLIATLAETVKSLNSKQS